MQIVLLSGGSGSRLWPLSNNTRSKQFLKLLSVEKAEECVPSQGLERSGADISRPAEPGICSQIRKGRKAEGFGGCAPSEYRESMVQRVLRQLRESGVSAEVTVATSASQRDVIVNQLGSEVSVVTEPERRDTFPAIALASCYLALEKGCGRDEVVVVMPCDPYTELGYFRSIGRMAQEVEVGTAELVLMGIEPTYPSSKYGYVVPENVGGSEGVFMVKRFTEKPSQERANELIAEGAFWNGGVFAFRLGYLLDIVSGYISLGECGSFEGVRSRYGEFPKISFDYEVAEKAQSVAVVSFAGKWKDLGTWNTLSEELGAEAIGNVLMADCENTNVVNELELPIMCIGTNDLVVAASPDGILVSDKKQSEKIKSYAEQLKHRPMYEERRWGEYKVVDEISFSDGYKALTKQLVIRSGKFISYQVHRHRDEVWTFVDGEGLLVLDGVVSKVSRGMTVHISKGTKHAVRAVTDLRFIEVQSGDLLVEEDIERFEWEW